MMRRKSTQRRKHTETDGIETWIAFSAGIVIARATSVSSGFVRFISSATNALAHWSVSLDATNTHHLHLLQLVVSKHNTTLLILSQTARLPKRYFFPYFFQKEMKIRHVLTQRWTNRVSFWGSVQETQLRTSCVRDRATRVRGRVG